MPYLRQRPATRIAAEEEGQAAPAEGERGHRESGLMQPRHTRLPSPCPKCGQQNDTATSTHPDTPRPEPGSFALCWFCYAVSRYDENMTLQPVDLEQMPTEFREAIAHMVTIAEQAKQAYRHRIN